MKSLQASIASYSGSPVTLLGVLTGGVLSVAKVVDHSGSRLAVKGVSIELFVSDSTASDADCLFSQADIQPAIEAYYRLKNGRADDGSPRMVIMDDARRANPDAVLQTDKLTERGQSYQLSDAIRNEHIAALAMCKLAERALEVDDQFEMFSAVDALLAGCLVTI